MNMNLRGALLPLTLPGRRVLHVASCNLPKVIRRAILCAVFSNGRIVQGIRSHSVAMRLPQRLELIQHEYPQWIHSSHQLL